MYGDLGNKLVQHAKRTQTLPHLPPYQTDIVRSVTREVRDLDTQVSRLLDSNRDEDGSFDPSSNHAAACALLVNHLFMRRNKRCLMAYHRVRTQKLEELCWRGGELMDEQQILQQQQQQQQIGSVGVNSIGNPGGNMVQNLDSLSPEEEDYFKNYSEMLVSFKGQWTDIDLTGSLEPPKDLFIDVRVLKDAGEVQTEYGSINLTKNSQFYVRLSDVERLIAQGFLQRLS